MYMDNAIDYLEDLIKNLLKGKTIFYLLLASTLITNISLSLSMKLNKKYKEEIGLLYRRIRESNETIRNQEKEIRELKEELEKKELDIRLYETLLPQGVIRKLQTREKKGERVERATTKVVGLNKQELEEVIGKAYNYLENYRITSGFYDRRRNDIHKAVDLIPKNPKNYYYWKIHPLLEGIVEETGYNNILGKYVIIKHGINNEDIYTLYAHFSKIFVKKKDRVTINSVIGYMGNTGRSHGAHLHLAMYKQKNRTRLYINIERVIKYVYNTRLYVKK